VTNAQRQRDGRSNRMLWIIGGVVVLVGLALVIAVAVSASSSSDEAVTASEQNQGPQGTVVADGDVELGTVAVTGQPLTSGSSATGQVAPDLAGQNLAGDAVSITNDGQPKLVMFLAHWCPHCQAEVPRVQSWLDANGMPSGVSLYSVATGTTPSRDNYPPSDWLVGKGWTVPVLVDDAESSAAQAWGLQSYPYFVAVGADGKVVAQATGELSQAQFYDLVDAARAG
jgi:thiol-disulfide isomerase/thioredoxin